MNIWETILEYRGWKLDISNTIPEKCVICVAPHTSNWDFPIGYAAYRAVGRKANFLMKKFWFFFPMGFLMRRLGGIPVDTKSHKGELTKQIIRKFRSAEYLNLAVTPEGTRSATEKWRTGFLYIAHGANVPIYFGVLDYNLKKITIQDYYVATGDVERDMAYIRKFYSRFPDAGLHKDKFRP